MRIGEGGMRMNMRNCGSNKFIELKQNNISLLKNTPDFEG